MRLTTVERIYKGDYRGVGGEGFACVFLPALVSNADEYSWQIRATSVLSRHSSRLSFWGAVTA